MTLNRDTQYQLAHMLFCGTCPSNEVLCCLQDLINCTDSEISDELQSRFVNDVLETEPAKTYKPSQLYVKNLLKKLICMIEDASNSDKDDSTKEGIAICDDLLRLHAECMVSSGVPGYTSIPIVRNKYANDSYAGNNHELSTSHLEDSNKAKTHQQSTKTNQSDENLLLDSYICLRGDGHRNELGLRLWPAAIVLSNFILSHTELFENKRVLELGSGIGLCSCVVQKYCAAKRITVTDYLPEVVETLKHNMSINYHIRHAFLKSEETHCEKTMIGHAPRVEVDKLDWSRNLSTDSNKKKPKIDVIIASDVLYENELIQQLVYNVLAYFLNNNNRAVAYIMATVRNEKTIEVFYQKCEDMQISVEVVESLEVKQEEVSVEKIIKRIDLEGASCKNEMAKYWMCQSCEPKNEENKVTQTNKKGSFFIPLWASEVMKNADHVFKLFKLRHTVPQNISDKK